MRYKRLYMQAKRLAVQDVDYAKEFVSFLGPKLKKKKGSQRVGDLKKRDIRSKRQKKAINDAIAKFKKEQEKATLEKKQAQGLVNKGYADDEKDARNLMSLFAVLSEDRMKDRFGFSCQEIVDLNYQSEDVGFENVKKVAEWVKNDILGNTPSYLQEYLQEDDAYKMADLILNIMENEDISIEDLQMAFSEEPTQYWREKLRDGAFDISEYLDDYFF